MPARAILLVRHAESTWNALGRWQGWSDPGLSARGREQARSLGPALSELGVDALVASDLARARETAEIAGHALGLRPRTEQRLRERDLGGWSGLTTAQIAGRWPEDYRRLRARDPELRPGGGESMQDVRARVRRYLEELSGERPGERLALVTHGGLIRALLAESVPNAGWVATTLGALLGATPDPRAGGAAEGDVL